MHRGGTHLTMENLSRALNVGNQAILSDDATWAAKDWLEYLASEWRSAKSRELDALGGEGHSMESFIIWGNIALKIDLCSLTAGLGRRPVARGKSFELKLEFLGVSVTIE